MIKKYISILLLLTLAFTFIPYFNVKADDIPVKIQGNSDQRKLLINITVSEGTSGTRYRTVGFNISIGRNADTGTTYPRSGFKSARLNINDTPGTTIYQEVAFKNLQALFNNDAEVNNILFSTGGYIYVDAIQVLVVDGVKQSTEYTTLSGIRGAAAWDDNTKNVDLPKYYNKYDSFIQQQRDGSFTTCYWQINNDGTTTQTYPNDVENVTISYGQDITRTLPNNPSKPIPPTGYTLKETRWSYIDGSSWQNVGAYPTQTVKVNSTNPNVFVYVICIQIPPVVDKGQPPVAGISVSPQEIQVNAGSYNVSNLSTAAQGQAITKIFVQKYHTPLGSTTANLVESGTYNKGSAAYNTFFGTHSESVVGRYTYRVMKVYQTDGQSSTNQVEAYVDVKDTPVVTPPPTPPPVNLKPVPIISADDVVPQGTKLEVSGKHSYDPDGFVVDWFFDIKNSTGGRIQYFRTEDFTIQCDTLGEFYIYLDVWDDKGGYNDNPAIKKITVVPPRPHASITASGRFVDSSKLSIDTSWSTGSAFSPIVSRFITITPVEGTGAAADKVFKVNFIAANGHPDGDNVSVVYNTISQDFLCWDSGDYIFSVTVTNSVGGTDTASTTVHISPLPPPVVHFTTAPIVFRDIPNGDQPNYAIFTFDDMSYTPDGYPIVKRIWSYRYDSNNDGNFDDEQYVIFDSGNNTHPTLQTPPDGVGHYSIDLHVEVGWIY
jgi:hypothetical protein